MSILETKFKLTHIEIWITATRGIRSRRNCRRICEIKTLEHYLTFRTSIYDHLQGTFPQSNWHVSTGGCCKQLKFVAKLPVVQTNAHFPYVYVALFPTYCAVGPFNKSGLILWSLMCLEELIDVYDPTGKL